MKSKGFAPIIILILLVLVGVGAYYFGTKNKTTIAPVASAQPSSSPIAISTPDPATSNWNKYSNSYFGISFNYPSEWKITNQSEENRTILSTNRVIKIINITMGGKDMNLYVVLEESPGFSTNQEYVDFLNNNENNVTPEYVYVSDVKARLATVIAGGPVGEPQCNVGANFFKEGKSYGFSLSSPQKDCPQTELLKQILSTFKFTQ